MSRTRRKIVASVCSAIFIFQAVSGVLDVVAKEMQKVQMADSYGPYASQSRTSEVNHNLYEAMDTEKNILTKEVVSIPEYSTYAEETEVIEERTLFSKTYEIQEGNYVKEVYFEPIHTEVNGELVEIDNTLENAGGKRSTPIYENKEGHYDVTITNEELHMETNAGEKIAIMQEGNMQHYDVQDNVILYSEVYDNIDMEYVLRGDAITSTFHINGPITEETISYTIAYGDLTVQEEEAYYAFVDTKEQIAFTYQKPVLEEEGVIHPVTITTDIQEEEMEITVTMPTAWMAESERVFPLQMQANMVEELKDITIDSSYIRSNHPNTTSRYYDLFVGYEDGSLSGGIDLGITRIYMHVAGLDIGPDKEIVNADLQLFKKLKNDQQWNTIEIRKTSGYINMKTVNWGNKPTDLEYVSTTTIPNMAGWQTFNITSYMQDIYAGRNNVIELRATNESEDYSANVFYGESGSALPRIVVSYRDSFHVRPDLDIDIMDMEMRIYAKENEGFYGVSFDGIAKPDSQVVFDVVKIDTQEVVRSEMSAGQASRYFVDPIFVSQPLPNVQTYTKNDSNYTTTYIQEGGLPEYDVPYEYRMRVTQGELVSHLDVRSDTLVKYKVKLGDTLRSISSYYGVSIEQIQSDNHLTQDRIKENDVLLVRMKKDNPKVSKDIYTQCH